MDGFNLRAAETHAGGEAARLAELEGLAAEAVAFLHDDEGLFLDVDGGEGALTRERMLGGEGEPEGFDEEFAADDAAAFGGGADDGEIEVFGVDGAAEVGGGVFVDGDLDAGMAGAEGLEKAGEEVGRDGGQGTEFDFAADEAADVADFFAGGFELVDDALGVVEEKFAGGGDGDVAFVSLEEFFAEFVLELHDLLAEGRLGDVTALGGAAEVFRLGDGEEVAELVNFHDSRCLSVE